MTDLSPLGSERPVDVAQIERSLAELWRNQTEGDEAITRAALWNVVAHTALPEHQEYVETLLEPADRLIVDSAFFDSPQDLELVSRVAAQTTTIPADLNWIRLEEWRAATASVFDPPNMRSRLQLMHRVRIVAGS